jgi:hypothetical protein
MNDNIAYYSDEQIQKWLHEFANDENIDKDTLPNIPFSWYELRREFVKRDAIQNNQEQPF